MDSQFSARMRWEVHRWRKLRRRFGPEFKLEAVKLVKEGGVNVVEAARDLGIHETSLHRWIKQYDTDHGKGPLGALTTEEREELRRLRRENRQLKMEREILKNHRGARHQPVGTENSLGRCILCADRGERPKAFWWLDPVKKRGPGTVADLTLVTRLRDPV